MAEKRDYYEVLGIAKGASENEIKTAYKKACLKWHPDKWVNGTEAEKKTAEEKFKEAAEAYDVLNDPNKKARYDQFGHAGMGGQAGPDFSQGFGDLNDILNNIFGGGGFGGGFGGFSDFFTGGRSQGPKVYRGRDIRTRIKLTLEEIAKGVEKEVTLEKSFPCSDCHGKGAKSEGNIKTCPACGGTGQVRRSNGFFVQYSTCQQCGGEGKIISNPCRSCGGSGLVRKKDTVKVRIPAGVEDGMQLKITGGGHAAKNNGINGDLLVVIEEIEHKEFKREGADLIYNKVVSISDAILGCDIEIPCFDGPYKTKIEPGTQSGTVLRLRGKGLPSVNGYGNGDLFVKVLVYIPKKISRDEKEIIEKLRDSENFEPSKSKEDKGFFDRLKNLF
jgi:molecular chaperone DnaJ